MFYYWTIEVYLPVWFGYEKSAGILKIERNGEIFQWNSDIKFLHRTKHISQTEEILLFECRCCGSILSLI